jgi:hypothetical protein
MHGRERFIGSLMRDDLDIDMFFVGRVRCTTASRPGVLDIPIGCYATLVGHDRIVEVWDIVKDVVYG